VPSTVYNYTVRSAIGEAVKVRLAQLDHSPIWQYQLSGFFRSPSDFYRAACNADAV